MGHLLQWQQRYFSPRNKQLNIADCLINAYFICAAFVLVSWCWCWGSAVMSHSWGISAPELVLVPPSSVYLSNGSAALLRCAALGNPQPRIDWLDASGAPVVSSPGFRWVLYWLAVLELFSRLQPRVPVSTLLALCTGVVVSFTAQGLGEYFIGTPMQSS